MSIHRNFETWLVGKSFTPEQQTWLEHIRDHIVTSLDMRMEDFELTPFDAMGNGAKAYHLFGEDLEDILKELTEELVS